MTEQTVYYRKEMYIFIFAEMFDMYLLGGLSIVLYLLRGLLVIWSNNQLRESYENMCYNAERRWSV